MNKLKLVRIIVKDLEEIKLLSEEVAESESDSTLIIDLALSRARLLCQEFELLRELSVPLEPLNEETEEDFPTEDEDEVSDVSFSDPELEIVNFEENEFPDDEELPNDETDEDDWKKDEEVDQEVDLIQENGNEDEEEVEDEDDLTEEDEDMEDEEDLPDEAENADGKFGEDETEMEVEDEDPPKKTNIEVTELKNGPMSGIREILIEEMDDDLEPIKFSPLSGSSSRPVMHEIPKPENPIQEKMVVGESFHKERSVNDVISENKSNESNINNGPISSLRAAIGLNDRFIFIREIFDNNTDKYNTVIDQLDKLETIQQAVELLKANLSLQKNETSLKFVDLLKRRFSK